MDVQDLMLKESSYKGRTIVITGGGTGLGRSMAHGFAALGGNVVIASRRMEVLQAAAEEIGKETGSEVLPVECDVRDPGSVEGMLERTIQHFGSPHLLVNNAAGNFISPTERLSPNAFKAIIDIVLMGTVHCTLTFGKHWIAGGLGDRSVLNITTTYAWTGSAYVVPSATAKAGVLAMTRSLAVEWAKYGIRNNAVAPGPFPTEGAWERLLPGEMGERFDMKEQIPLKRTGEHHELVNLATYLGSSYASFFNGEVVTIDGGEWLKDAGQFNMFEKLSDEEWDELQRYMKKGKG